MSRIRLYVNDAGRCALHTSGFSWLAGFMLPIWALQRQLFGVAVLGLVYAITLDLVIVQFDDNVALMVLAAQVALFGTFANRLHRVLLERKGWRLTARESAGPGAPPDDPTP